MPKELYNQPLIIVEPDDDDRVSFGQPSVSGAKNMVWSVFKVIVKAFTSVFTWVDFTPQGTPPAHVEGRVFYDDTQKTLTLFTDELDSSLQIGQEMWFRALNDTGFDIDNGNLVYISGESGGMPTIALADASDGTKSLGTIGAATHSIEDGTIGIVTTAGKINDVDTSLFSAGDIIYLDAVTPGFYTNVRPSSPNYAVKVGQVSTSAVSGTGEVQINAEGNTGDVIKIFNGAVLEDNTVSVSASDPVITLSFEQTGGGDLSLFFNGGFTFFESTPAATIALTAGTDAIPVENFVYIPQSTGVLTVSTSGFPGAQHVPVATVVCQSALSVENDGPYKVHAWTDHLSGSDNQGHLSHVNKWIRGQNATWESGVDPSLSITVNGGAIDNVYFSNASGIVLQLHSHTFPARDMETGDDLYIINDFTTKYDKISDLSSLDTTSLGVTLRNNNTYYSVVIMGIVSEEATDCKLMANAPTGSYGNSSDAVTDPSGFSNYGIPANFKGTAFLIARVVLRYQTTGSGTLTEILTEDIRGLLPATAGGGGTPGGGGSDFSDALFTVFNSGDPTKIIQFLASTITTGTTRTLTVPDISGLIAIAGMLDNFSFGGQAHGGNNIKVFSASATFDATDGNNQEMLVTASTTIAISNELPGTYIITLEIDTITPPTITIGASFGDPIDNNAALINADNDINIITLVVRPNATKYYSINTITA